MNDKHKRFGKKELERSVAVAWLTHAIVREIELV